MTFNRISSIGMAFRRIRHSIEWHAVKCHRNIRMALGRITQHHQNGIDTASSELQSSESSEWQ
jgi:hypothetical protein